MNQQPYSPSHAGVNAAHDWQNAVNHAPPADHDLVSSITHLLHTTSASRRPPPVHARHGTQNPARGDRSDVRGHRKLPHVPRKLRRVVRSPPPNTPAPPQLCAAASPGAKQAYARARRAAMSPSKSAS
eukprot:3729164-Rhodomonas_salina.2